MKLILKDDERIIVVLRATKLVLIFPLLIGFFLIFLPIFLFIPLFSFGITGTIFFWFSVVVGLLWTFKKFSLWVYNKAIVTNKRIIDRYQKNIFDVVVSEANFSQIEDISFRKKGLLQHIFDYGSINISLENLKVGLEIKKVKRPAAMQALLIDLKNAGLNSETSTLEKMIERFKELGPIERKALLHSLGELDKNCGYSIKESD